MPADGEAPLVATLLAPTELAALVPALWDAGEAVLPLDPSAPPAAIDRMIEALRPTHLADRDGRRALPGGVPTRDDVVAVVATSGTTGEPKGAELTRTGAIEGARAYAAGLGATPADRWLGCLPMHHVAGLAVVPRSLYTGIPATVHDGFDVDAVARSPAAEGTTIVLVVATMLRRLLDAGAPLSRFRKVLVGAGPLAPDLRERCAERGVDVVNTYGMTEAWGGVAFDGVPIPGVELAVAADGEVLVRGSLVMAGYRLRPDLTAEVIDRDGWYHTGDVGELRDGVLVLTDRLRDLVKTGGVTVSPTEVEQVLVRHPAVADVTVAGAPDPEWGERVVAFVVPADPSAPPSLDDLRAFARDRLAPAKLPRELRLLDAIPRSSSGKALRRALLDR
jgi:O-succinylbenzoic acid--CoA ligase